MRFLALLALLFVTMPSSFASAEPSIATIELAHHVLFKSRQDAITWSKSMTSLLQAAFAAKTFQVIDKDPRYKTLQGYVHSIWDGYKKLFPEETKDLNEPPVVLVTSEISNSFVPKSPTSDQVAHVVFVFTGFLDTVGGVGNSDAIKGVIAHEIAHSVFMHILPEYAAQIDKFYDSEKAPVPYLAARDPLLDIAMNNWISLASEVGPVSSDDLLNLPSPGLEEDDLANFLSQMFKDLKSTSPECTAAVSASDAWNARFDVSLGNDLITIREDGSVPLRQLSQQLVDALTACFGPKKESFLQILSESTGTSTTELSAVPGVSDTATLFDSSENVVAGLQAVVAPTRKGMQSIESQFNFANVGYFSFEEHADDLSVLVNSYIDKNGPAITAYLRSSLSAEKLKACNQILSSGEKPPMGFFSDPHHGLCYRIYNVNSFSKMFGAKKEEIAKFAKQFIAATVSYQ